jgi:hypothetical protein
MPSTRRLFTLAGAAFVGLAASAVLAAPATAHTAELVGRSVCDPTTGKFSVTWTLKNEFNLRATLTAPEFTVKKGGQTTPGTGTLTKTEIAASETTVVGTQTGVPGNSVAKLKVHVTWYKANGRVSAEKDVVGKDEPCGTCTPEHTTPPTVPPTIPPTVPPTIPPTTPPTEPPTSTSPSPSGGTGGGGESPTPSGSKSAPPALPVTGSQAAIYGGGSALLLGAGAGLFLAARRRRIQFEA